MSKIKGSSWLRGRGVKAPFHKDIPVDMPSLVLCGFTYLLQGAHKQLVFESQILHYYTFIFTCMFVAYIPLSVRVNWGMTTQHYKYVVHSLFGSLHGTLMAGLYQFRVDTCWKTFSSQTYIRHLQRKTEIKVPWSKPSWNGPYLCVSELPRNDSELNGLMTEML